MATISYIIFLNLSELFLNLLRMCATLFTFLELSSRWLAGLNFHMHVKWCTFREVFSGIELFTGVYVIIHRIIWLFIGVHAILKSSSGLRYSVFSLASGRAGPGGQIQTEPSAFLSKTSSLTLHTAGVDSLVLLKDPNECLYPLVKDKLGGMQKPNVTNMLQINCIAMSQQFDGDDASSQMNLTLFVMKENSAIRSILKKDSVVLAHELKEIEGKGGRSIEWQAWITYSSHFLIEFIICFAWITLISKYIYIDGKRWNAFVTSFSRSLFLSIAKLFFVKPVYRRGSPTRVLRLGVTSP